MPYRITGPAILKMLAPVPIIKPSLLNSRAGETTEFYIEVLLPMNNPGGMENSFMITDGAPKTYEDKADGSTTLSEDNFTGKEYYRWTADSIITHTNGGERTYPLTEKTKKVNHGIAPINPKKVFGLQSFHHIFGR